MTNPNRTDYEGPPLSGPGLLWINSKVTDKASLSDGAFTRWYEDIHIPDIIAAKPGGVQASWRYECANKDRAAPYLAVYKVPDMAFLQSPEFKAIPMTHPTLPDNGPIHRFADFDARFMGHVETWKSKDAKDGRTDLLVSEAIEPADSASDSFHERYRKDYIFQVAKLPGWQRTSLLKLVFKKENKDEANIKKKITPTWLALHEFREGGIHNHQNLTALLGRSSTSAKEIAQNTKEVDVAAFELLRGFGAVDQRWADVDETIL